MSHDFVLAARLAAILAITSLLGGCALSNSVQSISGSVSSPFESSSASSDGDGSAMYQQDVERTTLAHLRADGDAPTLRRSLDDLAREQGVTDWANDAPTVAGLRAGLRAAGLDEASSDAYVDRVLGPPVASLPRLAEHTTP